MNKYYIVGMKFKKPTRFSYQKGVKHVFDYLHNHFETRITILFKV